MKGVVAQVPMGKNSGKFFMILKKSFCDYKMDNINSVAVFLHIIKRVHYGQVWEWAGQVIVSQIPTREYWIMRGKILANHSLTI